MRIEAVINKPSDLDSRAERGSIVITSNRGFEAWGEILGDAMVAAALIDRLMHHATMVTLEGKSSPTRTRQRPRIRRPTARRVKTHPVRRGRAGGISLRSPTARSARSRRTQPSTV